MHCQRQGHRLLRRLVDRCSWTLLPLSCNTLLDQPQYGGQGRLAQNQKALSSVVDSGSCHVHQHPLPFCQGIWVGTRVTLESGRRLRHTEYLHKHASPAQVNVGCASGYASEDAYMQLHTCWKLQEPWEQILQSESPKFQTNAMRIRHCISRSKSGTSTTRPTGWSRAILAWKTSRLSWCWINISWRSWILCTPSWWERWWKRRPWMQRTRKWLFRTNMPNTW